jgi:hypothetical protein
MHEIYISDLWSCGFLVLRMILVFLGYKISNINLWYFAICSLSIKIALISLVISNIPTRLLPNII